MLPQTGIEPTQFRDSVSEEAILQVRSTTPGYETQKIEDEEDTQKIMTCISLSLLKLRTAGVSKIEGKEDAFTDM